MTIDDGQAVLEEPHEPEVGREIIVSAYSSHQYLS